MMFQPGDLVFAEVEGWKPWPAKIMCKVSTDVFKVYFYGTRQESLVKGECIFSSQDYMDSFSKKYGYDQGFDFALEEMKNDPDIFVVSYDDRCDHKCMTCDESRMVKERVATGNIQSQTDDFHCSLNGSELASMKSVKVVMKSIRNVLYKRESKNESARTQTRKENSEKNIRMSRKKITEKKRKNKGRLINKLYFLPSHSLKKMPPGALVKMVKTLSCSMCPKLCRNTIGLKIHLHDNHPEYQVETPKSGVKSTMKKVPPMYDIETDSSFVDIDELIPSSCESFYDNINDLLQSSNSGSSSDDLEDLLRSSDSESSSDDIDALLRSSDRDPSHPICTGESKNQTECIVNGCAFPIIDLT